LAEENAANLAEALVEAVAPVKIKVGGYFGFFSASARRRGSRAWEKMKAALLGIR